MESPHQFIAISACFWDHWRMSGPALVVRSVWSSLLVQVVHRNYETLSMHGLMNTATTVVWGSQKSRYSGACTRQCRPSHTLWRDEASVVGECVFPSPAYGVCPDSETCIYCNESTGWMLTKQHFCILNSSWYYTCQNLLILWLKQYH